MAKKAKASGKGKKSGGGSTKLLGGFGLIAGILFIPTTVFLAVGMLPTIVVFFTVGTGKRVKAVTIGAMNFSGCLPFLLKLWTSSQTIANALSLISSPRTIVVVYAAAGVGYLIDWAMGGVVKTIMVQKVTMRLKDIKKRQLDMVERWGPEVRGDMRLDANGFPTETKASATPATTEK